MRKGFAALLLSLWVLTLAVSAAQAEGEAALTVATTKAAAGDTVSLPVTIENCEGLDSLEFRINYDPAVLEFVSLANGDVFESEFLISNPSEAGLVRVAAISAYGLTASGTVLTLEMRVLNDAGSAVTLTDVRGTLVDPENNFAQSKAYFLLTDGGVAAPDGLLPAAHVTPWIAETPVPVETPMPAVLADPAAAGDAAAAEESPAEQAQQTSAVVSALPVLAAAAAALAVVTAAILLITHFEKKD